MKTVDLRSDTVTLPTQEMREAIYWAELGDDVYGEDPTVNRLEKMAAELVGKEAAVLVTSGSQANLASVLAHTQRGDEVILGDESHILLFEAASAATFGSLQMRALTNGGGMIDPSLIEHAIRPPGLHNPRTGLVCLENTHNRCGGAVLTPEYIGQVCQIAHSRGVPVHLDGARIFNAAAYLGIEARKIVAPVDSVSFCLSKGLSAPVGSLVCGSADFVNRARKIRKMAGGGMRQAGIIAAAGIVALEKMIGRLTEDHENARRLAYGLASIAGIAIDPARVQTNIVVFDMIAEHLGAEQFIASLRQEGVRVSSFGGRKIRMVTHYGIEAGDIDLTLAAVRKVLG
ncbi:MAG: aminotransferase class I/II-fold pyridoxal phosphate-dependent enzyme [Chloroflexi bacterium]|nr:aminotransferase class I/II-fold pyridoxal phosphate-dependent enzyme [Chloroflexota bacterium]